MLFQFFSQECFAKEQTNKQKKRSPLSFRFLFSLHPLHLYSPSPPPPPPKLEKHPERARRGCARRVESCGKGAGRKELASLSSAGARAGHFLFFETSRPERKKGEEPFDSSPFSPGHLENDRESPEIRRKRQTFLATPRYLSSRGREEREEGGEREEGEGGNNGETNRNQTKDLRRVSRLISFCSTLSLSLDDCARLSRSHSRSPSKFPLFADKETQEEAREKPTPAVFFVFPFYFVVLSFFFSRRLCSLSMRKTVPGGARRSFWSLHVKQPRVEKR